MSAIASYGLLLDFGIGGAVVKYVAEHVARGHTAAAREVVASAAWLYLGLAFAAAGIGVAVAPVLPSLIGVADADHRTAEWLIVLTCLNVAVAIAFTTPNAVLRGLQRYDLHNAVCIANSLVEAAATVAVLLAGWGVVGIVGVFIPVNIATGIASAWVARRVAPDLRIRWRGASLARMRVIASFSSSLFAIEAAGRLQTRTDEFVIALFRPLTAVTPYALARKLGEAAQLVAVQFLKVMMPLASELHAADQEPELRKLYIVASRVALGVATAAAVMLTVFSDAILTLWVGAEYAQYAPLVMLLAIANLIGTSQWPAVEILLGIARHRVVAVTSLAAGIANVVLSVVLLPIFGLVGVALGTLIPTAIASLCVVMPFAMRMLGVSLGAAVREIWMPALLPAMAAAAVAWTLRAQSLAVSVGALVTWIVASGSVYLLAYLAMPASRAERRLLSDASCSAASAGIGVVRGLQPWWAGLCR
jgi:O-antigen/teichoic acid export membrane protein